MNGFSKLAVALALVAMIGCATQVTVTPTDVFTPSSQFVTIPASGFATAVFVIGKS